MLTCCCFEAAHRILIRVTFYVFIPCDRILTRRCAKRVQPVGLKHLPWQPLVIDEQQEQNSIEGWEGSQILSATLPLIYMTDIKGTEDHWPPATWLSSKAVHHFMQEPSADDQSQHVFCKAHVTLLELTECVSCVHAGHGVQTKVSGKISVKWMLCFFASFFFSWQHSTSKTYRVQSSCEAGFSQMLQLLLLLLRWHYVNGDSLQITLMVTWWGVLGSRLTNKHRQTAD